MDIIGLEPSEIYTLRDEYPDLLPGDELAAALPRRSWMIDEFLIRPGKDGRTRMDTLMQRRSKDPGARVLLHGHCYQKAQSPTGDGYPTGEEATVSMLKAVGYQVTLINSGCCGMAGAFGYEAEHYQVSKAIGELKLLPTIRAAQGGEIIAASGVSCQSQISDGTEREAIHPIRLVF
jgi:Fe-S oxidoreductase